MADFYHRLGDLGYMPPKAANAESSRAALKALELDEMLPEAHAMMGVLRADDFDWKGADGEFHRALELDPKSEDVGEYYCLFYLVPMRRFDEAIAASQKALELNPLSPILQFQLGQYYCISHQYKRAIVQCHNALELDPHGYQAHRLLGEAYIEIGKFDEGIQAFEMALQLSGYIPLSLGLLGWAYARAGRPGEAQKRLSELQDLAQKAYVIPSSFAHIYLGLGEIDKCIDWLERAVNEREPLIASLKLGRFYPLRSHPRYRALMRKMNLNP